jgi:cytochrome oxidase assembly protein ShyY1
MGAGKEATPACGIPRGGQLRISIPNDHMQYAITWCVPTTATGLLNPL